MLDTPPDLSQLEERERAKLQAASTGEDWLKARMGNGCVTLGVSDQESKIIFDIVKRIGTSDWTAVWKLFPQEGKGVYTRNVDDLRKHYEQVQVHIENKKERAEGLKVSIFCLV